MLVLSREKNEVICIGPDVKVQIVDIRCGKVRVGIVAPKDVAVDREEVFLSKRDAHREAQSAE